MKTKKIKARPFGEQPRKDEPYNASDVVALADSRFLFCDNNISDALFEFHLTPNGQLAAPLLRRPIDGISPETVDDLEGLALVEDGGRRFIFAVPSMSLKPGKKSKKKKSKRGSESEARSGLLRIAIDAEERLHAELIPDFRSWLIDNAPALTRASRYLPDDGGLNIEGLGWNAAEQALLLGVRTPTVQGKPLILGVRLKETGGPWTPNNLEMLSAVILGTEDADGEEQGVRAIDWDQSRGVWTVVIGNSTSSSKARFRLYAWDGNMAGKVRRFDGVRFHRKMKVEGVAHGSVAGRGAIVFVDDAGGYQVLWYDDPCLT